MTKSESKSPLSRSRNQFIYWQRVHGQAVSDLAKMYGISRARVREIVIQETRILTGLTTAERRAETKARLTARPVHVTIGPTL